MLINLEDPGKKQSTGVAILQLGFRPFFMLAGLSGVILILLWGLIFAEGKPVTAYGSVYWHGHEMVFGFVVAVAAGFLLTAVKNWTGRQTAQGTALLLLVLLWLLGRILPFFPATIPYWLIAAVDLSFLPAVAATLIPLLLKTKNHRNLVFIGILFLLAAANVAFHLSAAGFIEGGTRYALYAAVYTILLLISIMGGRVIPFFIERGLGGDFKRKSFPIIDNAASLLLLLLGVLHTAGLSGPGMAAIALLASVFHLIRLYGWYGKGVWQVPLLWVLVLAYSWIVIGLFLMALAMAGVLSTSLALHALTIGGIGSMTIGMMVRVSMGHSGRELYAPALMASAFVAMNLAVVVRVFLPLVLPLESYPSLVLISALIWAISFSVFVVKMSPVYFSPRVDGRPG
jgi:uncharacterized protein involved in response to NO